MTRFRVLLGILLATMSASPTLTAQRPQFGVLVGRSLVGGGDSRTLVGSGVAGADQAGLHLRGFANLTLEQSPFTMRAELFYNRLTSGSNTFDAGVNGKAALLDESVGLTGSFVGTTSRTASVAPYFSLGAGVFTSRLGHNPEQGSMRVTETYYGMGLGLVAGAGLRVRVGRPELLLDWR
jgi:hypothetical protein